MVGSHAEGRTHILSISGLSPCIFPTMVPLFEFFTQPLMPAFMQLSRQYFVNPTPGGCEKWARSLSLLGTLSYLELGRTPRNHIAPTNLSRPFPFPWNFLLKLHKTNDFSLCHRSIALKLQLTRCFDEHEIDARSRRELASVFLVSHFHPRTYEQKAANIFTLAFRFAIFSDRISRSNWRSIDSTSLNITNEDLRKESERHERQ